MASLETAWTVLEASCVPFVQLPFPGKMLENHGKIMENHGKMLGNVWKIPELVGFLRENHGKSQSIHG